MKGLITNKKVLRIAKKLALRPRAWRTQRSEFAASLLRQGYGFNRAWATAVAHYRLDSIAEVDLPRRVPLAMLDE